MSFLGRMLRFLFWALIVWWAAKLVSWVARGADPETARDEKVKSQAESSGKRLLKDPVCGVHVAEDLALPLEANGEVLHFCSPECREKYESSVVPRAASA